MFILAISRHELTVVHLFFQAEETRLFRPAAVIYDHICDECGAHTGSAKLSRINNAVGLKDHIRTALRFYT